VKRGKGLFITFEGIEGSGKSTQIEIFCDHLDSEGIDYVRTLEPGGTQIGNEIRKVLLSVEHSGMSSMTELLLYAASRAQHVAEVIRPSLERGTIVVCDRFSDSTLVYQGFGRGLDKDMISGLNQLCTDGLSPDLTFILDVDVETGLRRNRSANKVDRLELEAIEFHRKVREGYLSLSSKEQRRIKLIRSDGSIDDIAEEIKVVFTEFIQKEGYVIQ
jgi:dTMP kinase